MRTFSYDKPKEKNGNDIKELKPFDRWIMHHADEYCIVESEGRYFIQGLFVEKLYILSNKKKVVPLQCIKKKYADAKK